MPVNPKSDRSDAKPITSPSPIVGSTLGHSITTEKDELDSSYSIPFDSVGKNSNG